MSNPSEKSPAEDAARDQNTAAGIEALDARRHGRPRSLIIPLTIAAGFFMEGLDSTILNTALPRAAVSLHTTPLALSLAVTSYLLALAVFIPISGWLADRFGARRIFCTAIVTFTFGSFLCGISQSLAMLVGARVLQGLGGAMMTPVGRLVLARCFPKEELIVATSYTAIPGLIGPMLGPVVGGFLTTYLSWHWIFFINIPIGVIGLSLAIRFIPEIPETHPGAFDFLGFLQIGLALACAQLAIEFSNGHVISTQAKLALVGVAAVMALLYWRHARRVPRPVVDLALFRIRPFAISVLFGGLSRLGILASPFLLPLLFQIGLGMDPFDSGLLVCLASFGAMFTRVGAPTLMRRFGLRSVLIGNAMLLGAFIGGFTLVGRHSSPWLLAPFIFGFGVARTIQFAALNALSLDLPADMMSKGTSTSATAQRLSQSAGVAIAVGLLSWSTGAGHQISLAGFAFVFRTMALLVLTSIVGFRYLAVTDGQSLTGHRRRAPA